MLNLQPWRERALKTRVVKLTALYAVTLSVAALAAVWLNGQQAHILTQINTTQQAITALRGQNQTVQQQLNLLQKSQQSGQKIVLLAGKVRFVDFMQLLGELGWQQGRLTLAEIDASRRDQQLLLEGEQLSEQEFEQLQETLAHRWLADGNDERNKLTHFVADHNGISFRLISGVSDD